MKIGIITILKVNNYGAELQAYATQAILKKLGHNAEIIDYLFYKNPDFKKTAKSSPLFRFSIKTRIAEHILPLITRIKEFRHRKASRARMSRFNTFHSENTSMSGTYHSIEELYNARLDYDVYITGSDQVWNPGIYSSILPYFLDFAPAGARRIAYASSFGVAEIPDFARHTYECYLKRYHAIGVREKNAVAIVKDVAGRNSTHVLDPTLLLKNEEWEKIAKPIGENLDRYILLYELTPCGYIRTLAEHIKAKKGWNIVRVCKNAIKYDNCDSIIEITDAGPAEFLWLFSNAEMVITNSFHGTAFAINFQKSFYTVLPGRKQNNSRQLSLMDMLHLTDRALPEGAPLPEESSFITDFCEANVILENERKKSLNFLTTAINE